MNNNKYFKYIILSCKKPKTNKYIKWYMINKNKNILKCYNNINIQIIKAKKNNNKK